MYMEVDPTDYYILHPRPAYLIVTRRPDGGYNVMAASWVSPISEEPPLVALAIGKESYTHELIRETKEFTINFVGEEHADMVYKAGTLSGRRVDKWKLLGLEPLESKKISVPGIRGCYGFLECYLENMVDAGECSLFIARIVASHVKRDLYTRYGWDLKRAKILLHLRGRAFVLPGKLVLAKR